MKELDVTAQMTQPEMDIASRLQNCGLSQSASALAVVMVTREHSRPESELIDIVRQYQGLESQNDARNAVLELKRKEWLVEQDSYGITLLRQHKYLKKKIADTLDDESVKDKLKSLRSTVDPYVEIVGSMSEDETYTSYLERLKSASSEVCLPMLATTSQLDSVPILKQRAGSGVRVRILLGSPSVVAALRGNAMRQTAEDAIRGWSSHAQSNRNIEVRVAHDISDTYLSTCLLIDERLLRFDVYDPHRQRSLQGTLVEFSSPDGLDLNICRVFRSLFDDAWNRARPVDFMASLAWRAKRHWNLAVGLVFGIVAFLVQDSVLQSYCVSFSVAFLLNGFINAKKDLLSWLRRLFQ